MTHWTTTKRFLKTSLHALSPKKSLSDMTAAAHLPPSPPPTLNLVLPPLHPSPTRSAIELSKFPPSLTKSDIRTLFTGFRIADFDFHNVRSFLAPLRVRIEVLGGAGEADRAVRELDGVVVDGRRVCVKRVENATFEAREVVIEELVDEMKIKIINTARTYHTRYTELLLDVREWMTPTTYYAFLQGRYPITDESSPEVEELAVVNRAEWCFLAAGMASVCDPSGRTKALRDLLRVVETQGEAEEAWTDWEGSVLLSYEY
ncbi:hypothetical protein M011DRAFT_340386 [Sporormia fimetaria CBS 119925]|uniref:RRM domain-containing protein n=1 Tax=Sporormia fimetaria CBS 119925 TaxID=1340428 RepID=A0A6A6VE76_9PLEO|nr:hypothetical protein M011DRAFT_340386 [Sporormia fimetaria CBS 119925]